MRIKHFFCIQQTYEQQPYLNQSILKMKSNMSDLNESSISPNRSSVIQSINDSDPIYATLQMLSLKVMDLAIRLEKLTQSESDTQKDQNWESKYLELFETIVRKEKQFTGTKYYKSLYPLFKYFKHKRKTSTQMSDIESQKTLSGQLGLYTQMSLPQGIKSQPRLQPDYDSIPEEIRQLSSQQNSQSAYMTNIHKRQHHKDSFLKRPVSQESSQSVGSSVKVSKVLNRFKRFQTPQVVQTQQTGNQKCSTAEKSQVYQNATKLRSAGSRRSSQESELRPRQTQSNKPPMVQLRPNLQASTIIQSLEPSRTQRRESIRQIYRQPILIENSEADCRRVRKVAESSPKARLNLLYAVTQEFTTNLDKCQRGKSKSGPHSHAFSTNRTTQGSQQNQRQTQRQLNQMLATQ